MLFTTSPEIQELVDHWRILPFVFFLSLISIFRILYAHTRWDRLHLWRRHCSHLPHMTFILSFSWFFGTRSKNPYVSFSPYLLNKNNILSHFFSQKHPLTQLFFFFLINKLSLEWEMHPHLYSLLKKPCLGALHFSRIRLGVCEVMVGMWGRGWHKRKETGKTVVPSGKAVYYCDFSEDDSSLWKFSQKYFYLEH